MARRLRGETCFYCRRTFPDMTALYRHRHGRGLARWCGQ